MVTTNASQNNVGDLDVDQESHRLASERFYQTIVQMLVTAYS